jgi:hypothetical protein
VRPEALLDGSLKGVDVVNATVNSSSFDFSTFGFYGRGHFFYVDPEGVRWNDYGLDTGNYTVNIPEFGYDRKFMQDMDMGIPMLRKGKLNLIPSDCPGAAQGSQGNGGISA